MSDFFTSDLHFWHTNVIKYCNRPFISVEEMNEGIIDIWNKQVDTKDTVYHFGDFAFNSNINEVAKLFRRLNGNKVCILGNHDREQFYKNIAAMDHTRILEVCHFKEIKIEKKLVVMCHYPLRVWNKSHYGSYNLFGHCHGSLAPQGKQLDVGIDNALNVLGEFRLFTWDDIRSEMAKQHVEIVDHHRNDGHVNETY